MLYVIDTDIFTLIQQQARTSVPRLFRRVSLQKPDDLSTTVISFQEQMKGCLAAANSAKSEAGMLHAYLLMQNTREAFCRMTVLPFDVAAKQQFDGLVRQRLRVGTMDLRIAAITLVHKAVLVTRNTQDFERIPTLRIEDWAV
jgi:tRNA(fMet)-specific endonuclease VapC